MTTAGPRAPFRAGRTCTVNGRAFGQLGLNSVTRAQLLTNPPISVFNVGSASVNMGPTNWVSEITWAPLPDRLNLVAGVAGPRVSTTVTGEPGSAATATDPAATTPEEHRHHRLPTDRRMILLRRMHRMRPEHWDERTPALPGGQGTL